MATHFTHLLLAGKRLAVLYRFDQPGDGIPEHAHGPDMVHDIRCTRGSIMVYGTGMIWCHQLKAGQVFDTATGFDSTQPHEIQAIEPLSSCVNEYYRGIPAGYEKLTDADKDGSVALPLKLQLSTGLI